MENFRVVVARPDHRSQITQKILFAWCVLPEEVSPRDDGLKQPGGGLWRGAQDRGAEPAVLGVAGGKSRKHPDNQVTGGVRTRSTGGSCFGRGFRPKRRKELAQTERQVKANVRRGIARHGCQLRYEFRKAFREAHRMLSHPGTGITQAGLDQRGIKSGESLERIKRVQPRLRRFTFEHRLRQQRDRALILPLQKQTLRRQPPPAVRMRQQANEFRSSRLSQIRSYGLRFWRISRHDAVDASHRVAAVKVHILLELFGNRFRRLDELAIHVHDVEVSVRAAGKVTGPEPGIRGCQELPVLFLWRALRQKAHTVRNKDVAMNQVGADVSGKQVAAIFLGKGIAGIDGPAGGCGEVSSHHFSGGIERSYLFQLILPIALLAHLGPDLSPVLRLGKRENSHRGLSVVRNVLGWGSRGQERIAVIVAPRRDHVAHMECIFGYEAVTPVIHSLAELSGSGFGFEKTSVEAKAEISAQNIDGREIRTLGEGNGSALPVVRRIDPVVNAEPEIRDTALRIDQREAREKNFALVGLPVTVEVFQVEYVGGGRDEQSSLPRQHTGYLQKLVGENCGAVYASVAIGVFEEANDATRRFSGGRIVRQVQHFGDKCAPLLVKNDFHRVEYVRLGGEQLNAKVLIEPETLQRFFG